MAEPAPKGGFFSRFPAFKVNAHDTFTTSAHHGSKIPVMPAWTSYLRIAQLALAFIALILAAVASTKLKDYGGSNIAGLGMTIFCFVWTLLYDGWYLYCAFFNDQFYNLYANLGLEALSFVWWLTAWALCAHAASGAALLDYYDGILSSLAQGPFLPGDITGGFNCIKGAAAVGAIVWALFIATGAFLVLAFLKINKGPSATGPSGLEAGTAAGAEKPNEPQHVSQSTPLETYPQQQQQVPPEQQQQYQQPQQFPPPAGTYPNQPQQYPQQPAQGPAQFPQQPPQA